METTETFSVGFDEVATTPFGLACHEGKIEEVKKRIAQGIDWKEEGLHPLHGAVYAGDPEITKLLLDAGSPVSSLAFYVAYRFSGAGKLFSLLRDSKYTDTLLEQQSSLILFDAARAKDLETMQFALEHKANVNATDYFYGFEGWTALHHMANDCNVQGMKLLMEHHAEVNLLNKEGRTPLFLCAKRRRGITRAKRKECVAFLLSHGASIGQPMNFFYNLLLKQGFPIF